MFAVQPSAVVVMVGAVLPVDWVKITPPAPIVEEYLTESAKYASSAVTRLRRSDFADSVKYSSTIGAGGVIFTQSTGNTAPTITTTADGWTANIKNANTTKTCSIYIGSTSLTPANKEGEPKCQ